MTCSGETGNKSEQQVSHFKVGINSAGYFYPIQSQLSYVEAGQLPFNNQGWIIKIGITHECTLTIHVCVLLVICLVGCVEYMNMYIGHTLYTKSETSALRLVPCFARAGHIYILMWTTFACPLFLLHLMNYCSLFRQSRSHIHFNVNHICMPPLFFFTTPYELLFPVLPEQVTYTF